MFSPLSKQARLFLPLLIFVVLCLFCLVMPVQNAEDASERLLALIGGTLIDGTGADPVQDAVIVIRDGRIVTAGKQGEVAVPAGAKLIEVKNGTIPPGFIDTHVHNATAANLAAWAQAGVTTVRDVGAPEPDTAAICAIRQRTLTDMRLARLIAAGPPNGLRYVNRCLIISSKGVCAPLRLQASGLHTAAS